MTQHPVPGYRPLTDEELNTPGLFWEGAPRSNLLEQARRANRLAEAVKKARDDGWTDEHDPEARPFLKALAAYLGEET